MTQVRPRLEPLRYARTGTLEVAYYEAGPSDGDVTLLLHGFPYDIHSYTEVIPLLAEAGRRVIVPYLRGHGPTRFLDPAAPRSGQQAAIGTDVVDLMDALGIRRAILAGYDWAAGRPASRPRCGQSAAPAYDRAEKLLAAQPPITVPAVTLDGLADGNFPATDGSLSAPHFTGPRVHHQVPGAGHNLPQEAPGPFASAVLELAGPAMTAGPAPPKKGTRT